MSLKFQLYTCVCPDSCILLAVEAANEKSEGSVNQERSERISRMTEIEDLQAPRDLPLAPLCIKVLHPCSSTLLINIDILRCVSWIRILVTILILNKLMH